MIDRTRAVNSSVLFGELNARVQPLLKERARHITCPADVDDIELEVSHALGSPSKYVAISLLNQLK